MSAFKTPRAAAYNEAVAQPKNGEAEIGAGAVNSGEAEKDGLVSPPPLLPMPLPPLPPMPLPQLPPMPLPQLPLLPPLPPMPPMPLPPPLPPLPQK